MGQAEQDPDSPRSANNVFWQSPIQPLLNRVVGQVEVPAGKVNFRGSLSRSANNVFQPTVNSHKYWTLFINYDFRWLMVAEISENSDQSSDTVAEIRWNYQSTW